MGHTVNCSSAKLKKLWVCININTKRVLLIQIFLRKIQLPHFIVFNSRLKYSIAVGLKPSIDFFYFGPEFSLSITAKSLPSLVFAREKILLAGMYADELRGWK